jgi:hypothetical protein
MDRVVFGLGGLTCLAKRVVFRLVRNRVGYEPDVRIHFASPMVKQPPIINDGGRGHPR